MSPTWLELTASLAALDAAEHVVRPRCEVVAADALHALKALPAASVACVVTSPPYGSLKDYGTADQIGHGQHYHEEYLPALMQVFRELLRVAKDGAACWVVLDTIKAGGAMTPLPLEVITMAQQVGWTLHDMVIWDKGRTLPWSHAGRFRNTVEFVLLFAKGRLTTFDLDAVRDAEHLGPYWIRYPERYHPDGKAPSDLWHFPIPVQGAWNKQDRARHFCPFPVGLVGRMLALTTRTGDVVLDPFAGTSSVPAVAAALGRRGIGIEINPAFVRDFETTGYDAYQAHVQAELAPGADGSSDLRKTIIELRMQKYAKTLFTELSRGDRMNGAARTAIAAFLFRKQARTSTPPGQPLDTRHLGEIELDVLATDEAPVTALQGAIDQRVRVAPLSKFGIAATVKVIPYEVWTKDTYFDQLSTGPWFAYRRAIFYAYAERLTTSLLPSAVVEDSMETRRKVPTIFSRLELSLNRPVDP